MQRMRSHLAAPRRRGNATVVALVTLFAIGSLAGVILTVSYRSSGEISATVDQNRAFFAAQAGANEALSHLAGGTSDPIGSAQAPARQSGTDYWVEVEPQGDDLFAIRSHARAGLQSRAIEVMVRVTVGGPFYNALFAGNSSGDPDYVLELGGTGTQADYVGGNVYSGGDVKLSGEAKVDGSIRATGEISGKTEDVSSGDSEPIPDFTAMNYAATADVKVADLFSSGASYKSNSAGGSAWQLPESSPGHIFRKNPSDRAVNTLATAKDDFYLEDPYEKVHTDSAMDGKDAYMVTLSGVDGEPGASSNQKVFYIDGNLWMHNLHTYSMKIASAGAGVQVTFVVKGNIYISDNLFYSDPKKDGIAFIALKDSKVSDSGNIYFGDPDFGTLKKMNAFMYAENNFYDYNLDASGSSNVQLYGNMTAGNQVLVNRDYKTIVKLKTVIQHTQLVVDFDERIATGELEMPGLPKADVDEDGGLEVLSWREVTPD